MIKRPTGKSRLLGKYVTQRNELIFGETFLFSLEEIKVFKLIISKIDNRKSLFDDSYEITNEELVDLGFNKKHLHQNAIKALENLASYFIKIETEPTSTTKGTIKSIGLIKNNILYKKYSGKYVLSFHDDLKTYLLQLSKKITTYPLIEIADLKTKYSLKLFEYLSSISLKEFEISIEKLKKRLDIKDDVQKSYKVFGNLKLRVLDPVFKELNEKTTMKAEYEPIKIGNKITKIKITILEKETKSTIKLISKPHQENEPKDYAKLLLNQKITIDGIQFKILYANNETFDIEIQDILSGDKFTIENQFTSLEEAYNELVGDK